MDGAHTVRTTVEIDGTSMPLAPGQDLEKLKRRFEAAGATTGSFVDFTVVGDRRVSALISPGTRILIWVVTVQNERGDEDESVPFGEFYDDL